MILLNNFMRRETLDGRCLRRLRSRSRQNMNAVSAILQVEGVWVFDDASAGLVQEPFISGADNILDVLTEHIPEAATGFKIIFSARPFPGYTARFVWTRAEHGANWYRWPERKRKDGCVRPSLNISKALPKKSSCRRPLKAREIRRCAQ